MASPVTRDNAGFTTRLSLHVSPMKYVSSSQVQTKLFVSADIARTGLHAALFLQGSGLQPDCSHLSPQYPILQTQRRSVPVTTHSLVPVASHGSKQFRINA